MLDEKRKKSDFNFTKVLNFSKVCWQITLTNKIINKKNLKIKKMAKIKIIIDPTNKQCRCGSWLNHWKTFSQTHIRMCVEENCNGVDLIGVKIQQCESEDTGIYIVPLCVVHALSEKEMDILDSCPMISADIKATCGIGGASIVEEGML
jgi:hypothetical protein